MHIIKAMPVANENEFPQLNSLMEAKLTCVNYPKIKKKPESNRNIAIMKGLKGSQFDRFLLINRVHCAKKSDYYDSLFPSIPSIINK